MSEILDMVTGGAILPHVYCKKITLDRSSTSSDLVDITINMEMYQDKNTLSYNWLSSLNVHGLNLMDSLQMQITPAFRAQHVAKLRPSSNFTSQGSEFPRSFSGNVYAAQQFYKGQDVLPRKGNEKYNVPERRGTKLFLGGIDPGDSVLISAGSLLGADLSKENFLTDSVDQGIIREEMKDGKPYYVIPFEYKYKNFDPNGVDNSLGFLFYTYLNVPRYFNLLSTRGIDIPHNAYAELLEEFIIEGPVNTEIVFVNGQPTQTRQVFIKPDGKVWEGSVHLHYEGVNPDPTGYAGDGKIGDFKGWMVGKEHTPGANQPRLSLYEVPNNLISDFRGGLFDVPLDTTLGLGQGTEVFNLGQSVTNVLDEFLSPFQKEKRKDFIKDNDSEYSKLYVCRDKDNNARGMFFINMQELLRNNSSLYPILMEGTGAGLITPLLNIMDMYSILQKSRILELKLYRDRVKKQVINTRYEKYANDEIYEEPSQLIATLSDLGDYQTPSQNMHFAEVTGIKVDDSNSLTRYFMFTDTEVGKTTSGLYRYRVELEFKDGTYEFLYELYQELSRNKVLLDAYYDISQNYYVETQLIEYNNNSLVTSGGLNGYYKNVTKHYFDGQKFEHPKFLGKVVEVFETYPWQTVPMLLMKVQRIFATFMGPDGAKVDFMSPTIKNLIDPVAGSPKGINFFSRLLDTIIKKIQSILDATAVNKTGSEIDQNSVPNGYTFNNFLDIVVSPSDSIIHETHTFDHPSELFSALSNEDIYMDYLSIGTTRKSDFQGLRSLSPEYYVDRCKLDSIKFSPRARADWNNVDSFGAIGDAPDSFSNTGYSFLTPSIVELSDPSKDDRKYRFYYTAFNDAARSHIENENAPLYSEYFNNAKNYTRLLVNFVNYSFNKQDTEDADLTGFIPHQMPANKAAIWGGLGTREPYKRLFDQVSLTVHDSSLYNNFFSRQPGAVSIDIPDEQEYGQGLGLDWEDFSDGSLLVFPYLQDFFLNAKQNILRSPICWPSPYEYDVSLPNSFKFYHVRKSRLSNAIGSEDIAQVFMRTPLDSLANISPTEGKQQKNIGDFAAFFFFQTSLTAKIQVYTGASTEGGSAMLKDDDHSWRELVVSDLEMSSEQKLFCRIVQYDESLLGGINIPVLDKYFLIYPGGDNPFIPSIVQSGPPIGPAATPAFETFWEEQHLANLNEMILPIIQGEMGSPTPPVTPPPQATSDNDTGGFETAGPAGASILPSLPGADLVSSSPPPSIPAGPQSAAPAGSSTPTSVPSSGPAYGGAGPISGPPSGGGGGSVAGPLGGGGGGGGY